MQRQNSTNTRVALAARVTSSAQAIAACPTEPRAPSQPQPAANSAGSWLCPVIRFGKDLFSVRRASLRSRLMMLWLGKKRRPRVAGWGIAKSLGVAALAGLLAA